VNEEHYNLTYLFSYFNNIFEVSSYNLCFSLIFVSIAGGPGVRAYESSEFTDPLTEGLQLLSELLVALHRLTAALAAGAVAEVGGAIEPAELGVAAPAQVVALVCDVALVHMGLQVPEVQPHLVVLEGRGLVQVSS